MIGPVKKETSRPKLKKKKEKSRDTLRPFKTDPKPENLLQKKN